jgi:hypothetical protein
MVTQDDLAGLATIVNKLLQNDISWFVEHDLRVGDKGAYWILNYGIDGKNDINRLARGLVVQKPSEDFSGDPLDLIKSFPFIRFFNQGEPQADAIDLSNADMLEKKDGCMFVVFLTNGDHTDPHWHTRKMLSTHQPDLDLTTDSFHGESFSLMKIIGEYVHSLNWTSEHIHHTYVFELIHKATTVVTKYSEYSWGLHLLASRDLRTYQESTEDSLDLLAADLGSYRPLRWDSVVDSVEIHKIMDEASSKIEDFEGMVFRDRTTGKRIKLKTAEYVAKHHMLGNISYKRLIPLIFAGEEQEIISYFPHAQELVDKVKTRHNELLSGIVSVLEEFQAYSDLSKKDLWTKSEGITCRFTRQMIMRHIASDNIRSEIDAELQKLAVVSFSKDTYVGVQTFSAASTKYMDLLRLKDE